MHKFIAPCGPLSPIPDNLTIPQFILDSTHPLRPVNTGHPWMIALAFVVPHQHIAVQIMKDPREAKRVKESLIKYVTDHRAAYKRLAGGVVFIDAIPKNPSGKILRRVLKKQFRQWNSGEHIKPLAPMVKL